MNKKLCSGFVALAFALTTFSAGHGALAQARAKQPKTKTPASSDFYIDISGQPPLLYNEEIGDPHYFLDSQNYTGKKSDPTTEHVYPAQPVTLPNGKQGRPMDVQGTEYFVHNVIQYNTVVTPDGSRKIVGVWNLPDMGVIEFAVYGPKAPDSKDIVFLNFGRNLWVDRGDTTTFVCMEPDPNFLKGGVWNSHAHITTYTHPKNDKTPNGKVEAFACDVESITKEGKYLNISNCQRSKVPEGTNATVMAGAEIATRGALADRYKRLVSRIADFGRAKLEAFRRQAAALRAAGQEPNVPETSEQFAKTAEDALNVRREQLKGFAHELDHAAPVVR